MQHRPIDHDSIVTDRNIDAALGQKADARYKQRYGQRRPTSAADEEASMHLQHPNPSCVEMNTHNERVIHANI